MGAGSCGDRTELPETCTEAGNTKGAGYEQPGNAKDTGCEQPGNAKGAGYEQQGNANDEAHEAMDRALDEAFERGKIAGLQEAILAIMERNGNVTDRMRQDVYDNVYHDSLVNWVKSFR